MSTDTARFQILIIGGGLAGLAAASFLREQHDVTVLERSKLSFSSNDYAMSIAPNTHRLLLEQGIEDSNLKATILTYVWACAPDASITAEALPESVRRFGATGIFTRRSRIHAELHGLATGKKRPGKPVRLIEEVKITAIDVIGGTVTTEGGDVYRGDLIIGADGINSAVRGAVLSAISGSVDVAAGAAAVRSGLAAYLCTVPNAVLQGDPVLAFQAGEKSGIAGFRGKDPQKRIVVFPADPENFQIVAYHPEDLWAEQFKQSGSSIIKDIPTERAESDFLDFHPSIRKMLTNPAVWRIRDLDRISQWHAGKAILIGDAAHAVVPLFGLGCNIAIEDGEALGYLLRDLPSLAQIPNALISFERIRVPRAHMVQFASRQIGGLLSEEEQKTAGRFDLNSFMDKVYGYTSAKDAWEALTASES